MKRFLSRFLIPAALTAAAVSVAVVMVNSAESAERQPSKEGPPVVEHVELRAQTIAPIIEGTGVVEPAREATLSSQVSGRIVYLSPALVVGGRVTQGEVLVRLEKRDYEIAVRQQRATVQQAAVELELELAYGKVSAREWEQMGDPQVDGRLARRVPQAEAAKVKVSGAKASLERSKLDLSRTTIRAPFNATVVEESVEEGEIASPGAAIATLVGADALLVRVSVPVEALGFLEIPKSPDGEGSTARVIQRLGRRGAVERVGTVVRLVHQIDAESRTAQVLVRVDHPLDPEAGELPLLSGAYVDVEFTGQPVDDVLAVPRVAVVEGRFVWVVDDDQRLRKRSLEIAWGDADTVFTTAGVRSGDRVLTALPPRPLEGMEVVSEARGSEPVAAAEAPTQDAEG